MHGLCTARTAHHEHRRLHAQAPVVLALALLGAACGDDDESGTLDCAWFADENNCWRQTIRAAESCLPAAEESGTFSPDRASCTYADGATVTFASPIDQLPTDLYFPWDFTVSRGGANCIAVDESGEGVVTVTTAAGTVELRETFGGIALICPDGSRWNGGFDILECPFDNLPGTSSWSSSMSAGYGLVGFGDGSGVLGDGELSLFECVDEFDQAR